jgi:Uri superfamily endonuclease
MKLLAGFYVYVGSALGPGGLTARVARHLAADKKLRWHIDYLRTATQPVAVWYTLDPSRRECHWAEVLSCTTAVTVPLTGFGASDCTCCSHLFFSTMEPSLHAFRCNVHKAVSGHAPIRWMAADGFVKG